MKKINLNVDKFSSNDINFISNYIKAEKVVVIPTDTIYGLSALANNKKAIDRIYRIKKRDKDKPLIILMKNFFMIKKYCYLNNRQHVYIKKEINKGRPITFILKNKSKELKYLTNNQGGLSVRIPVRSLLLMKLMRKINEPIVSTSLNVSGESAILNLKNLDEKMDTKGIDLIVDMGKIKKNKTSKILDISDVKCIKIIRK